MVSATAGTGLCYEPQPKSATRTKHKYYKMPSTIMPFVSIRNEKINFREKECVFVCSRARTSVKVKLKLLVKVRSATIEETVRCKKQSFSFFFL